MRILRIQNEDRLSCSAREKAEQGGDESRLVPSVRGQLLIDLQY